jgi:hypothetical protein
MKRIILAALMTAGLAACATTPPPPPPPPVEQGAAPAFRARDFAWSAQPGSAGVRGQVAYAPSGARYSCAGQPVILTPDTPFSRWRIGQLYGSDERAAVPVSVVRGRQAGRPSDDYSAFVRHATCDAQSAFSFSGLPLGSWFIIVVAQPAASGAQPVALMRHVVTRAGTPRAIVIN